MKLGNLRILRNPFAHLAEEGRGEGKEGGGEKPNPAGAFRSELLRHGHKPRPVASGNVRSQVPDRPTDQKHRQLHVSTRTHRGQRIGGTEGIWLPDLLFPSRAVSNGGSSSAEFLEIPQVELELELELYLAFGQCFS